MEFVAKERQRPAVGLIVAFWGAFVLLLLLLFGLGVFHAVRSGMHEAHVLAALWNAEQSANGTAKSLEMAQMEPLWAVFVVSSIGLLVVVVWIGRWLFIGPYEMLSALRQELDEKNVALGREAREREQIMQLLESKSEMLVEQERFLLDIIEDQTEFICRFRPDGIVTFANSAYCELAGIPCESVRDLAHSFVVYDESDPWIQKTLDRMDESNLYSSGSVMMRDTTGRERWIEWVFRVVDSKADGQPVSYQAVGHDVTEMKTLYFELEKRVEERTQEVVKKNEALAVEISERSRAEQEAKEKERFLNSLLSGIRAAYVVIEVESDRLVVWNTVAEELLEVEGSELLGKKCKDALSDAVGDAWPVVCLPNENGVSFQEGILTMKGGRNIPVDKFAFSLGEDRMAVVLIDTSERLELQRQLNVAQKMESIGLLASGIAHEINTPIQYAGDSIRFIQEALDDFLKVHTEMEKVVEVARTGGFAPEVVKRVEDAIEDADLEFVVEEAPKACRRALDGIERVAAIVLAMKNFAHPGGDEKKAVDFNKALSNTITISKNEWKYMADVVFEPDKELPTVMCLAGDMNQVFLNIIVNAAHAMKPVVDKTGDKGTLTIRTSHDDKSVSVSFSDTGTGIKAKDVDKIFDPFFTTKEVGKGTGQGLAISHDIVVNKHGGNISVKSEEGKGTTFTVTLPL